MNSCQLNKVIRYEIFLGLNRKDFGDFDKNKVLSILTEIFKKHEIGFSLNTQIGGYVHDDGTYVIEDGIKMIFVGNNDIATEQSFIDELKSKFHQETILMIKKNIEAEFEA